MKICSCPEGALRHTASSPVRIHLPLPSVSSIKVSRLAASLLRYPRTTEGDCTTSSPGSSYAVISTPSSDMIFALNPGRRDPHDPNQMSEMALEHTTVHVSVKPVDSVRSLVGFEDCASAKAKIMDVPYPCRIPHVGYSF
jgi:hypothetical protein